MNIPVELEQTTMKQLNNNQSEEFVMNYIRATDLSRVAENAEARLKASKARQASEISKNQSEIAAADNMFSALEQTILRVGPSATFLAKCDVLKGIEEDIIGDTSLTALEVSALSTLLRRIHKSVNIVHLQKDVLIRSQEMICECIEEDDELTESLPSRLRNRYNKSVFTLKSLQKLDKTVDELIPNYKSFVVTICVVVLAMWYFSLRVSVVGVVS